MSRFNTGNPLGSGSPLDLDDNAKNMDLAVNSDELRWSDRFGRDRKSFEGMGREFDSAQYSREARFNDFISASGYQFLGDYGPGIELTEYNQLVRDENGEFWRVSGQVDLPYVTTGIGMPEDDAFVSVGDGALRQQLADPDKGAGLVSRATITVSTIGEMKQVLPGDNKVVNLTDSGRSGMFVWRDGDFSGQVLADEFEALYVASDDAVASGAWVREGDWKETGVMASWFGFASDELNPIDASTTEGEGPFTINPNGAFQKAFDFCADSGLTFVVDQKYWITGYLQMKTGVRWRFLGEGELVSAISDPVMGGFIVGRYINMSTIQPITDAVVWDLNIDLNRMASMNGLSVASLIGGRFHGATRIKNSLYNTTNLGGRAVQFEGDTCKDIHVDALYLENCSIGINSQALPAPSTYIASHISYDKVAMKNVGMPFNIDCTDNGSQSVTIDRMSTTVGLAVLNNCGRPEWLSAGERYKAGIITGDRGSGLYIANLRVINDDDYGLVGALLKGTMYGVTVGHADIYGQFVNICDFNYLDFITSASSASHPSWADVNVAYRGGASPLEEVLNTKDGGDSLGPCRITLKAKPSQVSRICNANLGLYSNSQIILINADSGKEYPARTPRQFVNYGNTFSDALGVQKVSRLMLDTESGVPRTFFVIPMPNQGRSSVQLTATTIAGQSASTAACTAVLALISIVRDGTGAITTSISGSPLTASALDGYTSSEITFSVSEFGEEAVSINITQTNNLGVGMGIFASAEVLQAYSAGQITIVDGPIF